MNRIIFLLLVLPCFALAEPIYYGAEYQHNVDTDSNRLDIVSLDFSGDRSDIFWAYPEEKDSVKYWSLEAKSFTGDAAGADFSGQKFLLGYSVKENKKRYAELFLGFHEQEVDALDESHSFGVGRLLTKSFHVDGKLALTARIDKDLSYAGLDLPAALVDFKRRTVYQFSGQYRFHPKWRSRLVATATNFSDDNERDQYSGEVLYGWATSWPWIWSGVFYEQLENSKQIAGYWTPDEFKNYGAKLEASFQVYRKLQANTEFKFYRLKEEDSEWGDGHTFVIGLQYGIRGDRHFKISFMDIESTQEASAWSQDTTAISFRDSF